MQEDREDSNPDKFAEALLLLDLVNEQKVEKGGQWKEDKRAEEEKKHWLCY